MRHESGGACIAVCNSGGELAGLRKLSDDLVAVSFFPYNSEIPSGLQSYFIRRRLSIKLTFGRLIRRSSYSHRSWLLRLGVEG